MHSTVLGHRCVSVIPSKSLTSLQGSSQSLTTFSSPTTNLNRKPPHFSVPPVSLLCFYNDKFSDRSRISSFLSLNIGRQRYRWCFVWSGIKCTPHLHYRDVRLEAPLSFSFTGDVIIFTSRSEKTKDLLFVYAFFDHTNGPRTSFITPTYTSGLFTSGCRFGRLLRL